MHALASPILNFSLVSYEIYRWTVIVSHYIAIFLYWRVNTAHISTVSGIFLC